MITTGKSFNLEQIKYNGNKISFILSETFSDFKDIIIKPNVIVIIDNESEIYDYINNTNKFKCKVKCKYILNNTEVIINKKIFLKIDLSNELEIKEKILSNDYKINITTYSNYFSIYMHYEPNLRKLKIKKINKNL